MSAVMRYVTSLTSPNLKIHTSVGGFDPFFNHPAVDLRAVEQIHPLKSRSSTVYVSGKLSCTEKPVNIAKVFFFL